MNCSYSAMVSADILRPGKSWLAHSLEAPRRTIEKSSVAIDVIPRVMSLDGKEVHLQ